MVPENSNKKQEWWSWLVSENGRFKIEICDAESKYFWYVCAT